MNCPKCPYDSRVLSTRRLTERRRECLGPQAHRFTTIETLAADQKRLLSISFKFDSLRRLIQDFHQ